MCILVVDDNELVRSLIVEVLARDGHDVLEAESGQRALELLDDPSLALVVSDLVMDGLSGARLIGELHTRRPDVPVLIVTGATTGDVLGESLVQRGSGLLPKPFSTSELRSRVSTLLARQPASVRTQ
jgi:DNA-binding response OmpR family regulator